MYTPVVKRLQIYIEEQSDQALAVEAAATGVSKASIIRRLVAAHIGSTAVDDPVDGLVGSFDEEPGNVDAVLYGR